MSLTEKPDIIIAIHKIHSDKIFDETKKLEIRKRAPKNIRYPYTALVYETKNGGGAGAVVGVFSCGATIKTNVFATLGGEGEAYRADIARRACLSVDELCNYANGADIYGLVIDKVERFSEPRRLSEYGLKRPPQSWQHLQ